MEELKEIFLKSKVRKDGRRYYKSCLYSHIVWNFYNSENQISKEDMNKYLIHHKDGDFSNDNINNLEKIKWGKHTRLHRYGKEMSEESRNKISSGNIGKKVSEETKIKLSELNKGKILSEETRKKISLATIGKKSPMKGKKLSIDTAKKMSVAKIGKHLSEETKEKISKSHLGEKNPFFGKKHSEESRKKMSLARRKRNLRKI